MGTLGGILDHAAAPRADSRGDYQPAGDAQPAGGEESSVALGWYRSREVGPAGDRASGEGRDRIARCGDRRAETHASPAIIASRPVLWHLRSLFESSGDLRGIQDWCGPP